MQHNLHYAQSELCSANIQIKNLNVRISDFRVIIKNIRRLLFDYECCLHFNCRGKRFIQL